MQHGDRGRRERGSDGAGSEGAGTAAPAGKSGAADSGGVVRLAGHEEHPQAASQMRGPEPPRRPPARLPAALGRRWGSCSRAFKGFGASRRGLLDAEGENPVGVGDHTSLLKKLVREFREGDPEAGAAACRAVCAIDDRGCRCGRARCPAAVLYDLAQLLRRPGRRRGGWGAVVARWRIARAGGGVSQGRGAGARTGGFPPRGLYLRCAFGRRPHGRKRLAARGALSGRRRSCT